MSNYFDGVTGQLLTEEAIINSNVKTIKVNGDTYDMLRAMLYMASPDSYVDNSSGEGGFMCFYDQEEYNRTTELLTKFGMKWHDQAINNSNPKNKDSSTSDTTSPYPSNNGIKKPIF